MTSAKSRILRGLLLAGVFVSVINGGASAQEQPAIDVSLEVRSGLPSPGWVITDPDEIAQLRERIQGLGTTMQAARPEYGGFFLLPNSSVMDFPGSVVVLKEDVHVYNVDGTQQSFQDTTGLRDYLVIKAKEKNICADSDQRETVVIDGCDSGVANNQVGDINAWCTVGDKISDCAKGASSHGDFVSCVSQLTNELESKGTISDTKKGAIDSCAAQASIP